MKDIIRNTDQLLPFRILIRFLIIIAFSVQIVIIAYNHLTGYSIIDSTMDFIIRLVFGSILSFVAGMLITIPDLIIILYLNRNYPWNDKITGRIFIQIALTIMIASIVSVAITLLSDFLGPYEASLRKVIINNVLIFSVANLILMSVLEAWLFFSESNRARQKAEMLEKELSQIRFEILKSQINPHFMFNSLNVLSGLIEKDVSRAQLFIDEFSQIYRYVLETIEKQVVTLKEELNFVRSYTFLQQIRYGDSLIVSVNIPADLLNMLLPPLSLQTVLENSIKHNIISKTNPLHVEISFEGQWLIVLNNLQPKISGRSTGLGQKNLIKRYEMISNNIPSFIVQSNNYKVKLPLISA
jgi:two-component system, LytTR family, sensor kinase